MESMRSFMESTASITGKSMGSMGRSVREMPEMRGVERMTDTSKDEHRVFRTKEEIAVDKALSQFAERVEAQIDSIVSAHVCSEYGCEHHQIRSMFRQALKKEVGTLQLGEIMEEIEVNGI